MKANDILDAMRKMDPESRKTIISALEDLVEVSTDKPTLIQKLQSRKFLLSLATLFAGIFSAFAGTGGNNVMIVTGGVLIIGSMLIYTLAEGHIDAARAKETIATINTLSGFLIGTIDSETAMRQLASGEDTIAGSGSGWEKNK